MPDLKITCAPILDLPRSAEIVIEGGVNATNATLLKDRITASLDRRTTFVSILMRNVAYINSSGFGTFVGKAKVNAQALHSGDIITVGPLRLAYYPAGVVHKQ